MKVYGHKEVIMFIKRNIENVKQEAEIKALKSRVGQPKSINDVELEEEVEHITLFEETQKNKADLDYVAIMMGVEL